MICFNHGLMGDFMGAFYRQAPLYPLKPDVSRGHGSNNINMTGTVYTVVDERRQRDVQMTVHQSVAVTTHRTL